MAKILPMMLMMSPSGSMGNPMLPMMMSMMSSGGTDLLPMMMNMPRPPVCNTLIVFFSRRVIVSHNS